MEKRKPHYALTDVQAIVADPDSHPFTLTALRGGLAMGLFEPEMRLVVLGLRGKDFYKSMTTYADQTKWQDVYHGLTSDGESVYIKVIGYGDKPVIQFKKR